MTQKEKDMTGKEVLLAIANGADPSDFEWYRPSMDAWDCVNVTWTVESFLMARIEFRRKSCTRVINGFTVPSPINEAPAKKLNYFVADPFSDGWFDESYWAETESDYRWLSRGLLFTTKEAAIANAKAMCGIDPEAE